LKSYDNNDYSYTKPTHGPFTFCKFVDPKWLNTEVVEVEGPIMVALESIFTYERQNMCHSANIVAFPAIIEDALITTLRL